VGTDEHYGGDKQESISPEELARQQMQRAQAAFHEMQRASTEAESIRQQRFTDTLARIAEDYPRKTDPSMKWRAVSAISILSAVMTFLYVMLSFYDSNILAFITSSSLTTIAVVFSVVAAVFGFVTQLLVPKRASGLYGIDVRAQEEKNERILEERIAAAKREFQSPSSNSSPSTESTLEVKDEYTAEVVQKTPAITSRFESYIYFLVKDLDFQIVTFDKKASELLDTGIKILLWGIGVYVISIGLWQYLLKYQYVGEYAVIGMVSGTLAFLVVEFLAAWYLRQYKGFVDSSANLVRVRSLFNRYLLSYHAIKEFSDESESLSLVRGQLLKVLEEAVKWPEPVSLKAGDLNHMVAMFESVSSLVEKVKSTSDKGVDEKPKGKTQDADGGT
jgi:hypothetical protein